MKTIKIPLENGKTAILEYRDTPDYYWPVPVRLNGIKCRFLGKGCSRTVYKAGNIVVKVEHGHFNEDEFRLYQEIPDPDKKYFAKCLGISKPVKRYRITFLIMEFVRGRHSNHRRHFSTIKKIASQYDINDIDPGRNFKVHKGIPVIYDYVM